MTNIDLTLQAIEAIPEERLDVFLPDGYGICEEAIEIDGVTISAEDAPAIIFLMERAYMLDFLLDVRCEAESGNVPVLTKFETALIEILSRPEIYDSPKLRKCVSAMSERLMMLSEDQTDYATAYRTLIDGFMVGVNSGA